MEIMNFIPSTLFILIVASNILGTFLKQIKIVKDNYIPLILLIFTVTFSILILGVSPESILQGILTWGASIGIHQTVHQLTDKNK